MGQMMEQLRILILGDAESPHVQRWAKEVQKRGFNTLTVSLNPKTQPQNGIQLRGSPFPLGLPRSADHLRKIIEDFKPHLIHAHFASSYGFLGSLVAGRIPFVISAWGSDILVSAQKNFVYRALVSHALRKANRIFADSKDLVAACQNLSPGKTPDLIQWGVDLSAVPARRDQVPRPFTFISARQHEPLYQIEKIIQGFLSALKFDSNLHLHILGRGSLSPALKKLAEPAAAKIQFHDFLPENQVFDLLSQSDCAISIPTSDGTAMSLLEAMACGLPLICSDLPANREWLEEGDNLFLKDVTENTVMEAMKWMAQKRPLNSTTIKHQNLIAQKANRQLEFDKVSEIYNQLSDH